MSSINSDSEHDTLQQNMNIEIVELKKAMRSETGLNNGDTTYTKEEKSFDHKLKLRQQHDQVQELIQMINFDGMPAD